MFDRISCSDCEKFKSSPLGWIMCEPTKLTCGVSVHTWLSAHTWLDFRRIVARVHCLVFRKYSGALDNLRPDWRCVAGWLCLVRSRTHVRSTETSKHTHPLPHCSSVQNCSVFLHLRIFRLRCFRARCLKANWMARNGIWPLGIRSWERWRPEKSKKSNLTRTYMNVHRV